MQRTGYIISSFLYLNKIENDEVIHYNEEVSKINKTYKEVLDTPEDTYNFEVEDCHTYYVTDNDVLVHNTCLYRGGNDMTISKNDIKLGENGNVLSKRGISVNSDSSKVTRFVAHTKVANYQKD